MPSAAEPRSPEARPEPTRRPPLLPRRYRPAPRPRRSVVAFSSACASDRHVDSSPPLHAAAGGPTSRSGSAGDREYRGAHARPPHQPGCVAQSSTEPGLRTRVCRAVFVGAATTIRFAAHRGQWLPSPRLTQGSAVRVGHRAEPYGGHRHSKSRTSAFANDDVLRSADPTLYTDHGRR
jgi:hypothetical protein